MDVSFWELGERVHVRPLDDERQRVLYSDRPCTIIGFRGVDGPDLEAFIETLPYQAVHFKQWFPVGDLVKERAGDAEGEN